METMVAIHHPHLFIDDTWVADSIRVSREWHQARKYRVPVLKPDRSHEVGCPAYGSAFLRDGKIHLWYTVVNPKARDKVCYATSEDGINFTKPDLGLYEWEGSTANNICLMPEEPGVIDCVSLIEDDEEPEWPLKAVYWQGLLGPRDHTGMWARRGLVAARSKDGVHWENQPGPFCHGWGDRTCALPVRDQGKFVLFTRQPENPYASRVVYRIESPDLVNWSDPVIVWKQELEDDVFYESYSMQAFKYGGMYLGFLERMQGVPDRLDTELVFSHDGVNWQRSRTRPAFLPPGQPSDWDADWTNMLSSGPVLKDNKLWFYYSGRNTGGGPSHFSGFPFNDIAIGVAILRIDGFASLRAGEMEGWLETPALCWDGGDLAVNATTRGNINSVIGEGALRVEIRDGNGAVVEGYERESCVPVIGNTAQKPGSCVVVEWQNGRTLAPFAGQHIRIRFYLITAHLFSFKSVPTHENAAG